MLTIVEVVVTWLAPFVTSFLVGRHHICYVFQLKDVFSSISQYLCIIGYPHLAILFFNIYITYFVKVSFLQAKYLLYSERFVFRLVRLVILSSIGCFHEQRAFIAFSSSPSNKDKLRALLCIPGICDSSQNTQIQFYQMNIFQASFLEAMQFSRGS